MRACKVPARLASGRTRASQLAKCFVAALSSPNSCEAASVSLALPRANTCMACKGARVYRHARNYYGLTVISGETCAVVPCYGTMSSNGRTVTVPPLQSSGPDSNAHEMKFAEEFVCGTTCAYEVGGECDAARITQLLLVDAKEPGRLHTPSLRVRITDTKSTTGECWVLKSNVCSRAPQVLKRPKVYSRAARGT
jgi:hypothetical protein